MIVEIENNCKQFYVDICSICFGVNNMYHVLYVFKINRWRIVTQVRKYELHLYFLSCMVMFYNAFQLPIITKSLLILYVKNQQSLEILNFSVFDTHVSYYLTYKLIERENRNSKFT